LSWFLLASDCALISHYYLLTYYDDDDDDDDDDDEQQPANYMQKLYYFLGEIRLHVAPDFNRPLW